jgi:hypothetical protein
MTSSLHDPYGSGYTCATMIISKRTKSVSLRKSTKHYLSSDRYLKPDSVKAESLVIVNQHVTVNTVLGPCTHRPSHPGS